MSLVAALGYQDKIEVICDTMLVMPKRGSGEIAMDCGTHIFKLHDRLILGINGVGAYAHLFVGDFLEANFSAETPTDQVFSKIRFGVERKVKSLAEIIPDYILKTEYLLAGFDSSGEPDLRVIGVGRDHKLSEGSADYSFSGNGAKYKIALLGNTQYFGQFNDRASDKIESNPGQFCGAGTDVLQKIIRDPADRNVGGGFRSLVIDRGGSNSRSAMDSWDMSIFRENGLRRQP